MEMSELFPVGKHPASSEVLETLMTWLYDVNQQKHFDIKAFGKAMNLIAAFQALEKEGTAAAF